VSIGRRSRLAFIAFAGVAATGVAGWFGYKQLHYGSFCQAVNAGASPEELTEHLRKYDPARLNSDGWTGSIEHTTTQPFACEFEIEGGKVIAARAVL